MKTNETLTIDNLQINNLKIQNNAENKHKIFNKISDLCFDIVKFLITGTIISAIFMKLESILAIVIMAIILVIFFISIGIWFILLKIN